MSFSVEMVMECFLELLMREVSLKAQEVEDFCHQVRAGSVTNQLSIRRQLHIPRQPAVGEGGA